jgi:hypothetical protein
MMAPERPQNGESGGELETALMAQDESEAGEDIHHAG